MDSPTTTNYVAVRGLEDSDETMIPFIILKRKSGFSRAVRFTGKRDSFLFSRMFASIVRSLSRSLVRSFTGLAALGLVRLFARLLACSLVGSLVRSIARARVTERAVKSLITWAFID